MSRNQKVSLITACILYVLTIIGFFYFSLTLIVIVFLGFTLAITYFAYLCYKSHNDYTGAEHLQQEIGVLQAEKTQLQADYETLVKEKDIELNKRQDSIDELTKKLSDSEEALKKATEDLADLSDRAVSTDKVIESLLPPDDDDSSDIDIIDVANCAIRELEQEAKKVGLRITVSSASDRILVKGSRKRLLIMFRNIIDNSIKYMQTAGTLVITISAIEDDIFIVLKDTGKGLPENETKHIFELNYQGSNRISGNGLGLTQAKVIVEHYGGTIYARSPGGNGMGIYIQLPTT